MNIFDLIRMNSGEPINGLYITEKVNTIDTQWSIDPKVVNQDQVAVFTYSDEEVNKKIRKGNLYSHLLGKDQKKLLQFFGNDEITMKDGALLENNFLHWFQYVSNKASPRLMKVNTDTMLGIVLGQVVLMFYQQKIGLLLRVLIKDHIGWLYLLGNNVNEDLVLQ